MNISSDITFEITRRYVQDNEHVLGKDICNKILGWIRNRSVVNLASTREAFDPTHSTGSSTCRTLMQVEAFFKKNKAFSGSDECRQAALKSFETAEKLCRITNRRLTHYELYPDRLDQSILLMVRRAQRFINTTLGDFKPFLEEIPQRIRFTSGATVTRSRRESFPFSKISLRPLAYPLSEPYLNSLAKYFGHTGKFKARKIVYNRVELVPKSFKTDRAVACEAEGSLCLQLAFDSYVKDRLRSRTSIDLSSQTRNQDLARKGSLDGSLSTVDLSMASDTLSFDTVSLLLPFEWFEYLRNVRAPFYRLNGSLKKYAKFSSMGNGATFSLETLVFASACYAVGSKNFSVYGDDIIIETELFDPLIRFLRYLGFIPNVDKSFNTGSFRESCGGNYHLGIDVTPFYVRNIDRRKACLCHLVNGLAKISLPGGKLEELLLQMVVEARLPLSPFSEMTMSGVHIDAHSAYEQGLIKSRNYLQRYKSYVPKSKSLRTNDSRSLFLWHHDSYVKERRGIVPQELISFSLNGERFVNSEVIRSRTPLPSHKYVRQWIYWVPPVAVTPPRLYGWADALLRRLSLRE